MFILEKLTEIIESKLLPLGEKIEKVRFLKVIRMAMMPLIPFIIAGSLSLVISSFPYIDKVLPASVLDVIRNVLAPLSGTTLSLISIFLAFLVGYNYAKTEEKDINGIYAGLTTLVSFFIISPLSINVGEETIGGVIPTTFMGAQGMFVALIVSYLIAKLYCIIINGKLKIKLPKGVPPMVSNSFEALIPIVLVLVVACIIQYIFTLTSYGNIHVMIGELLQKPLLSIGTGLPALLISQGLVQLLWFFGIHGDQIVGSVMEPILRTADMENLAAYQAGQELPYIITEQFRSLFVMIAFISLVIAVVIVSRSNRLKQVGKVALVPSTFCISEPIVFGVPIVMNVMLFIPWVLSRPLFGLIAYGFMYFGICPAPTGVALPWTTPPIISGFLATNSIMGAVVQIVCLIAGVLLFLPFVRMIDKKYRKEEA